MGSGMYRPQHPSWLWRAAHEIGIINTSAQPPHWDWNCLRSPHVQRKPEDISRLLLNPWSRLYMGLEMASMQLGIVLRTSLKTMALFTRYVVYYSTCFLLKLFPGYASTLGLVLPPNHPIHYQQDMVSKQDQWRSHLRGIFWRGGISVIMLAIVLTVVCHHAPFFVFWLPCRPHTGQVLSWWVGDWRVCASAFHRDGVQIQVWKALDKASWFWGEDKIRQDCAASVSASPQDCQVSSYLHLEVWSLNLVIVSSENMQRWLLLLQPMCLWRMMRSLQQRRSGRILSFWMRRRIRCFCSMLPESILHLASFCAYIAFEALKYQSLHNFFRCLP